MNSMDVRRLTFEAQTASVILVGSGNFAVVGILGIVSLAIRVEDSVKKLKDFLNNIKGARMK
jgi:hypothetical protein